MDQNTASLSENMLDSGQIASEIEQATLAYQEYARKKQAMEASMLAWLRSRVTPGMEVDLSHANVASGGVPPHLSGHRVALGNAHGTKKFRIESVNSVDIDLRFFRLATWTCSATPISEKTGKPMSGRVAKSLSYGSDSDRSQVVLQFSCFPNRFD